MRGFEGFGEAGLSSLPEHIQLNGWMERRFARLNEADQQWMFQRLLERAALLARQLVPPQN